ncbi:hypothetical protein [Alteromonas macleodii]|uniref:hypothetical protein n=1 Tax=Alteromonas macleodii TaxID=28108 RepID=UPI0031400FF5
MSKLDLSFTMDNAAFKDNANLEAARILRDIANKLENAGNNAQSSKIRCLNGGVIGNFSFEPPLDEYTIPYANVNVKDEHDDPDENYSEIEIEVMKNSNHDCYKTFYSYDLEDYQIDDRVDAIMEQCGFHDEVTVTSNKTLHEWLRSL